MSLTARLLGASAFIAASALALQTYLPDADAQELAVSGPVDMQRLVSFLPGEIGTSIGETSYDAATGATIVNGLRFFDPDNEDVGLEIGTLALTGFDMDLFEARMAGQALDTTGLLIDYMQATDITLYGVETLYGGAIDAYNGLLEDTLEALEEEEGEVAIELDTGGPIGLQKLDFRINSITLDDFMLRPFELTKKAFDEGEEDDAELFHFLQAYAAFQRAMGAASLTMSGLTFDMAMTEDDAPMSMSYTISSITTEGWQGGDIASSVTDRTIFTASVPMDEEDEDFPFENMDMSGDYRRQTVTDIRLDKALGWLARGELPPRTETDLMSLGVWTADGITFNMFGDTFYSMGAYVMDMSGFHWLVPTAIDMRVDDLVYNIGPLMRVVADTDPDFADSEERQTLLDVLSVMDKYGLSAPSFDADIAWRWDPETGPANLNMTYGLDGYGTASTDLDIVSSSFDDLASLFDIEDEDAREAAFKQMAEQDMRFSGFSLELNDQGGLDKLFSMAIEIMNIVPNEETAAFANMEPEDLRAMAAGLVPLGAFELSKVFPPAAGYARTMSSYINEGGKLRIAAEPPTPLSSKEIEKLPDLASDTDKIVDMFGLSVVHTPEAAE